MKGPFKPEQIDELTDALAVLAIIPIAIIAPSPEAFATIASIALGKKIIKK